MLGRPHPKKKKRLKLESQYATGKPILIDVKNIYILSVITENPLE